MYSTLKPSLSIITATYNAVSVLPQLIESLSAQTDKNFQWVVADGASDDGTLQLLQSVQDIDLILLSQPDFGIYDGLNRAIKVATGEYYIVCGADDVFYIDAISSFRKTIEQTGADILAANVMFDNKVLKPRNSAPWLWGHRAYISMHTIATVIKTNLHAQFGYYSKKYPIAADQLFIMSACKAGVKRHCMDYVAGEIGNAGLSSVDRTGNATEVYRVQLTLGRSKFVQTLLLFLRLLRT